MCVWVEIGSADDLICRVVIQIVVLKTKRCVCFEIGSDDDFPTKDHHRRRRCTHLSAPGKTTNGGTEYTLRKSYSSCFEAERSRSQIPALSALRTNKVYRCCRR